MITNGFSLISIIMLSVPEHPFISISSTISFIRPILLNLTIISSVPCPETIEAMLLEGSISQL